MASVDWIAFFQNAGISSTEAKTYADAFVRNNIGSDLVEHLDKSHLQDMGIRALGDVMRIILNAKKENVGKYIIRKDGPELSNKIEAEDVKTVGDKETEDVNIEKLSQKENSETAVGASSVEDNVRVTINKDNEEVFSCTRCNFSAKTITQVKKHMVWYRDDKWASQSQTIQRSCQERRKRGGNSDAGLGVPDKKDCKDQTSMDLKYPDTKANDYHKSLVEKESQKVGEKSIDTTSVATYMKVKFDERNLKSFCCTLCIFTAKTRKALLWHIKGEHFKMQIFRCYECSYTTDLKGNLKQHHDRKGHTGDYRDYICVHCEFATSTIAKLKDHMQSRHVGEIPNISLRPMSPVKDSDLIEEPMSPVKDSELIAQALINPVADSEMTDDYNTTGYESMEEAPVEDDTNDDDVREEMPDINEEHMAPLKSINVKVSANNGEKRKGKFKGEDQTMYCELCSYKTVQTTRLWKHVQKIHNKTIKITHQGIEVRSEANE